MINGTGARRTCNGRRRRFEKLESRRRVSKRRNSWEELERERERERESERGKTFSLVLVAILLGASTVVATRCVHRADERLVKEHGKALLNHSRRRASLRPCYFGYHDTDTLFHQISLRAYINFPLTSLASSWWRTYGKSGIRRPRYGMYDIRDDGQTSTWKLIFIHRSVNRYIQIFKNNLRKIRRESYIFRPLREIYSGKDNYANEFLVHVTSSFDRGNGNFAFKKAVEATAISVSLVTREINRREQFSPGTLRSPSTLLFPIFLFPPGLLSSSLPSPSSLLRDIPRTYGERRARIFELGSDAS